MSTSIAMITTYPPTQCGIATFSRSLQSAIEHAGGRVGIVDLPSDLEAPSHPSVIHRHIGADDAATTSSVLEQFDVAILQHEFGIWDGPDGVGIIELLMSVTTPVISVLHTVPQTVSGGQRRAMQGVLDLSDVVVVLSHSARARLLRDFHVRPDTVAVIPHGARSLWHVREEEPVSAPPRILTWGLIGAGKGIEWGITSMRRLLDRGVEAEYLIAGTTHPKVQRGQGEGYRQMLMELVSDLRLEDHVSFLGGYLTDDDLASVIGTTTAFLLPYDSVEQVTSGVLVESIAAGGPVVATAFPHAAELLAAGGGILVDHRDPTSMARALEIAITSPELRTAMKARCRALAADMTWDSVGAAYVELADRLHRQSRRTGRMPLPLGLASSLRTPA